MTLKQNFTCEIVFKYDINNYNKTHGTSPAINIENTVKKVLKNYKTYTNELDLLVLKLIGFSVSRVDVPNLLELI